MTNVKSRKYLPSQPLVLSYHFNRFTKIQISVEIPYYLHQEPQVEFRKIHHLFQKIIFPYLRAKISKKLGNPEDQFSLILMNTFNGEDNEG